jgi:hypothetical protein
MTGRIVGTIGPATAAEPKHCVLGRQFMAAANPYALPPANFFAPASNINFCTGVVDASGGALLLDLGNALLTGADGGIVDIGDLQLLVYNMKTQQASAIGTIPAQGSGGYSSDPDWYPRTAGVVALAIPQALQRIVQTNPLSLVGTLGRINEVPQGGYVRADTFVHRASPGDTVTIEVYASRFGQPLANAVVNFAADASQLQPGNYSGNEVPPVATPLSAIGFADPGATLAATTDANGKATLTLTMGDPGTPRWFDGGTSYGIDGQVYGIRPSLQNGADAGPVDPWNFVSVLLWSGFAQPATPTWADVQPIFRQYANLYPVMNRFLDMGDYDSVLAHTRLLTLAFGLDAGDPNSMPVTRDLSPAKRATILTWLAKPLPAPATPPSPPPAGQPAAVAVALAETARPARGARVDVALSAGEEPPPRSGKADVAAPADDAPAPRGGKAAAAARRPAVRLPAQNTQGESA